MKTQFLLRSNLILLGTLCAGLFSGCSSSTFRGNNPDDAPGKYHIKTEHVILHSDVKLSSDDPLIQELKELRDEIAQTLELKLGEKQVEVFMFEDETSYQKFLTNHYPGLPPRRAYFVGTSSKLAVYTVWTDRIREDLRHEFTHGVLHSALPFVPLWVDEGFAEYFELPTAAGIPREDYLSELARLQLNGWKPNLRRLEQLDAVGEMQRLDYAESWAWVHWMLHNNPQTRKSLLDYAHHPEQQAAIPLSKRLTKIIPNPEQELTDWIAQSSAGQ
ncbi:MAG: hypothetical protein JKY95_11210 [Planctomycetaceae bacterium]|nr:hypothetical protein [Planctomycetaceae bacterium]